MRISDLDQILDNSSSLEDFLAQPTRIEAYYEAAAAYFGKARFTREGFDAIIRQLEELTPLFPELPLRLWKKNASSSQNFSVECGRSVARNVDAVKWNSFLQKWIKELEAQCASLGPIGYYTWRNVAAETLIAAQAEIDAFEKHVSDTAKNKTQRRDLRRVFYQEFRTRPAIVEIAAANVLYNLTLSNLHVSALGSEDGEIIIAFLKDMAQSPAKLAVNELKPLIAPILSALRDRLPNLKDLTGNEKIFPRRMAQGQHAKFFPSNAVREGTYFFEMCPRPFHTLFQGLAVSDCTLYDGRSGQANPDRWAASLLEGAETLFMRTETSYHGLIQLNVLPVAGRKWTILEFWSALPLARPLLKIQSVPIPQPFYNFILREIDQRRAPDSAGLCVVEAPEFDNYFVTAVLMAEPVFRVGEVIGTTDDVEIDDPLISQLVGSRPRFGEAAEHPEGLIFTAMKFKTTRRIISLWTQLLSS